MKTGPVDNRTYDSRYDYRKWTNDVCGVCGSQAQEWQSNQGGVGLICSNPECCAQFGNGRWRL